MSRFVRRSMGLVAFASQSTTVGEKSVAKGCGTTGADSIGGVLERLQRSQPGKPQAAQNTAAADTNVAPQADDLVDADFLQLVDDLHGAVARLVREAYGVDATTHPR